MERVRNKCCVPFLSSEGDFLKNIVPPEYTPKELKCELLHVSQRLHAHQTLASTRRFAWFRPHRNLVPKDALDFALTARYCQTDRLWSNNKDIYVQPESLDEDTWRRLRNTRDLTPDREEQSFKGTEQKPKKRKIPYKYNKAHKVMIGGVLEKVHPSYIKLMCSSH
ncbi:unnamed protein product, partial [Phyllotreta striolata]